MNQQDREALLSIIMERSFKYSEEPIFKLQSGKMSQYYIDLKQSTLYPKAISLIGKAVSELALEKKALAVGGLTLGADPIAVSASSFAISEGKELYPFIVRKEAKGHGTGKKIEAAFPFPASVVVLDDVITTGGSTIKALDACIEAGLKVEAVVCIVDREEGGKETIEKDYSIPVIPLFSKTELFDRVKK